MSFDGVDHYKESTTQQLIDGIERRNCGKCKFVKRKYRRVNDTTKFICVVGEVPIKVTQFHVCIKYKDRK